MNQELGAKVHKGVEIELCSIAICILRLMRSRMLNVCMFAVSTTVTLYTAHTQVCSSARAAERIVGAQGKYKKWGSYYRLCERDLGAHPQQNLRFYML